MDIARDVGSQQKGFYGDVDVINACCPCAMRPIFIEITDAQVCVGEEVEICVESATGGNAPYSYNWSTNEITRCILVNASDQADLFSVTVSDADGAMETAEIGVSDDLSLIHISEPTRPY